MATLNAWFPELLARGRPEAKEENLFQIGGRGHYENPTSDLLAFFLDRARGHGFGTRVFDALLLVAQVSPEVVDTRLRYWIAREVDIGSADGRGRLDLVLESDSWVVVIENKIRHSAVNDFAAYRRFAEAKGKACKLLLLSVREERAPEGWTTVLWAEFIARVRPLMEDGLADNKWLLFLREFLDNVALECGDDKPMDKDRFDFAHTNTEALFLAVDLHKEYLDALLAHGRRTFESLEGIRVKAARSEATWSGNTNGGWRCIPLRFVLESPDLEIVLKVFPNGRFGLNYYPRDGVGLSGESLKQIFPPPCRIEPERGYLACVVANADELALDQALSAASDVLRMFLDKLPPT